ncbi:MAG: hypothetical protein J6D47_18810, partial [Peptostreptococcaceae bacterium]|nr:hypothetical protein [Peptostreptococcaceae bacterium]
MKKKAAIAMSLMTVAGSVVPAFADEIKGNVVDEFNLDNLRSADDAERIQAEKDLEVTKAHIESLVNEKDSNGNNVYKVD